MSTKLSIERDYDGLYWERRVCVALGLPRKKISACRAALLTEGTAADFVHLAHAANAVAYTEAGLARLVAALATGTLPGAPRPATGRETTNKPPRRAAADIPAGPPPRETVRVERVPQQSNLLLCRGSKPPRLFVVRVRDNTNFAAGMEFEAMENADGVWQFRNRLPRDGGTESTCGRLPRQKGRW